MFTIAQQSLLTFILSLQIWFKNQRAKYKQMNPQSSKEELQESAGSAEDLSPSNDYDGNLSVIVYANLGFMSPK